MRVRIVFNLKNKGALVPFHHQHILAALVEEIHPVQEYQNQDEKRIFYNFSGLKGQTRVGKYGLHFYSNKVTLVFAASSKQYLDDFLNKIFNFRELTIGQLCLVPDSVLLEHPPNFRETDKGTKFMVISPIVIKNPVKTDESAKAFISPETSTFSDDLYDSTMARMERIGQYTEDQIGSFFKFQVVPDPKYMARVKKEDKKIARIYTVYIGREKYEVRGYTIPFTLFAKAEVQDFVFNYGLGELAHKGFGMIDAVAEDFSQRVEAYNFPGFKEKEMSDEDLNQLYTFSVTPKGRKDKKNKGQDKS